MDRKKFITPIVLSTLLILSIYITFNSQFADWVQSHTNLNNRWVLSKITSSVFGKEFIYDILKVRDKNMVYLEIYKTMPTGGSRFVNKIALNQEFDGYFLFNNITTNLALNDMDGDDVPEILAPTFDHSMTPRLNVVKYNPEEQSFFLVLNSLEN